MSGFPTRREQNCVVVELNGRLTAADHFRFLETSVQLAHDPGRVGPDREPGATQGLAELLPELRRGGLRAVSDNGILGDPTGASSEEGEQLLREALDDLEATVEAWLTEEPA